MDIVDHWIREADLTENERRDVGISANPMLRRERDGTDHYEGISIEPFSTIAPARQQCHIGGCPMDGRAETTCFACPYRPEFGVFCENCGNQVDYMLTNPDGEDVYMCKACSTPHGYALVFTTKRIICELPELTVKMQNFEAILW